MWPCIEAAMGSDNGATPPGLPSGTVAFGWLSLHPPKSLAARLARQGLAGLVRGAKNPGSFQGMAQEGRVQAINQLIVTGVRKPGDKRQRPTEDRKSSVDLAGRVAQLIQEAERRSTSERWKGSAAGRDDASCR